jgi:hypothetical protein
MAERPLNSPWVGIVAAIFSAASFLLSAFLFTYCVPIVVGGNSAGCVVPHQFAATGFLFLGIGLLVLSLLLVVGNAGQFAEIASPEAASPDVFKAEAMADRPVTVRTKCQYCGAWAPAGSSACPRCGRPLAWSNRG